MKDIKYSNYGVTYPKGFKSAGINAGIKEDRNDMALVYSEVPAECAIVVTSNSVKAAPVIWDKEITKNGEKKQAVVVNVGSANACTGEQGLENTKKTAEKAGSLLDLKPEEILICSTGVIGQQLDMNKINNGVELLIENLNSSDLNAIDASKAILTTDTITKTASAELILNGKTVRIGAMAKGSGMIRPNMATMLSFCCTDVNIDQKVLQEMLSLITLDTYNMISVDGDMSTNDTAIVLANGLAENDRITSLDSKEGKLFFSALFHVEETLAKLIVQDGEGATKRIQVDVKNAKSKEDARKLAKSVVESSLVKTAIFGQDANWGRIMSSLGQADAEFDLNKSILEIASNNGSLLLFKDKKPIPFDEDEALHILSDNDIFITIDCNLGSDNATAWGCDLTYDYVKINGDYRT